MEDRRLITVGRIGLFLACSCLMLSSATVAWAQDQILVPEGEDGRLELGQGFLESFGRGRLLDQLRTGSRDEQLAAARELGRQRDIGVVPHLLAMLEGEAPLAPGAVTEAIIDTLGEIGDRRAVPVLLNMIDGRRPLQRATIRALGRIGDERALDPIASMLGNRSVTDEAITALLQLGPRVLMRGVALLRQPETSGAACLLLARLGDRRATWPMVQALNAPHARVRRQCAAALGQLGDPRAQRSLFRLLQDPDINVRRQTLLALVSLADGSLGPSLAPLVLDDVRGLSFVPALRGPTAVAAVPHLARYLAGADGPPRDAAIAALGRIGGAEAARSLSELLTSPDGYLRYQAATSLARLGPEHALEPLLTVARTEEMARIESLRGLADLYRPIPLIDDARRAPEEVRAVGATALRESSPAEASAGVYLVSSIRDEEALEGLVQLLSRPEVDLRAQVATALGWMGDPRACDVLRVALTDPAEEVQAAAAWAAGDLDCRTLGPELTGLLERGSDRVAGNVAWAVGAIGERGAAPTLHRRLSEGGPALRANAALALAALGDRRAGSIIRRRLRQERSPHVRAALIDALGRLGDRASIPLLEDLTSWSGTPGVLARDAIDSLNQGRLFVQPRGAETFRTRVIDDAGEPLVGVWYTIALPDRRMMVGVTDRVGEITIPDLPVGSCTIGFGRTP